MHRQQTQHLHTLQYMLQTIKIFNKILKLKCLSNSYSSLSIRQILNNGIMLHKNILHAVVVLCGAVEEVVLRDVVFGANVEGGSAVVCTAGGVWGLGVECGIVGGL